MKRTSIISALKILVCVTLPCVCMLVGCSTKDNCEKKQTAVSSNNQIQCESVSDDNEQETVYLSNTFRELSSWIKDDGLINSSEKSFKNIKKEYKEIGYILNPVLNGNESDRFLVDTEINKIQYIFFDRMRIATEKCYNDSEDISKIIKGKYGYTINKTFFGEYSIDGKKTRESILAKRTSLSIGGEQQDCVIITCDPLDSTQKTEHTLSFKYEDMIVSITSYSNTNDFEFEGLKGLRFEKVKI